MNKGERIKTAREKIGISQTELAERIGVSKQNLYKYENAIITNIPSDKIEAIARICDVSPAYIMGWSNEISSLEATIDLAKYGTKSKKAIKIPVLGYVAAGVPIEAIEEILDYEELDPAEFNPNYEYFGLKIKGDSMAPKIQDGDVVIVRMQPDIENGEVAIVCINGDNATCKQIKKHADGISLIPYNSAYDVKFYTNNEVVELPITVLGKVMELRRKF